MWFVSSGSIGIMSFVAATLLNSPDGPNGHPEFVAHNRFRQFHLHEGGAGGTPQEPSHLQCTSQPGWQCQVESCFGGIGVAKHQVWFHGHSLPPDYASGGSYTVIAGTGEV